MIRFKEYMVYRSPTRSSSQNTKHSWLKLLDVIIVKLEKFVDFHFCVFSAYSG
jgi:hypothetical protein